MNILILAAFDSANYVYPNLIKELKKRGHNYYVAIANKYDSVNYKMLIENNIELTYYQNIKDVILDTIDIAFIPANHGNGNFAPLFRRIKAKNIFTISLLHLNLISYVNEHVDCILCMGKNSTDYSYSCGFKYPCINIGNPQYDDIIINRKKRIKLNKIKNVMIIEQGAYPCGDVGKQQLADTLVAIARDNPAMRFVVKPRYVPFETDGIVHAFKKHFYDYINDCPENLILQQEYVSLEAMIKDFDAAITLCSTAYLDAALYGLPVMFLKGFDSEEVFNLPKANFDRMYAQLDKFGTVIDYRDVLGKPLKFRYLDRDELELTVYHHNEPASARFVDLFEFIKANYADKKLKFKSGFVMDYDDFIKNSNTIPTISISDDKFELYKKYSNKLNKIFANLTFRDRCLKWMVDMSPLYHYWDIEITHNMTEEDVDKIIEHLDVDSKNIIFSWFDNNMDLVSDDAIIQHYYFTYLYESGRYDDILNYSGNLVVPEVLDYFKFNINMVNGNFNQAMYDYVRFRERCDKKELVNLSIDTIYNMPSKFDKKFLNKENILVREKFFGYIFRHKLYTAIIKMELPNDEVNLYYKIVSAYKLKKYDICADYYTKFKKLIKPIKSSRFESFEKFKIYLILRNHRKKVKKIYNKMKSENLIEI